MRADWIFPDKGGAVEIAAGDGCVRLLVEAGDKDRAEVALSSRDAWRISKRLLDLVAGDVEAGLFAVSEDGGGDDGP